MDKLPYDVLCIIFEYHVDPKLIENIIMCGEEKHRKLLLNTISRKYFFEYDSEYSITPRNYSELLHQMYGKIRIGDIYYIDSFDGYREILLNDLLIFSIIHGHFDAFISLIVKLKQVYDIVFKNRLINYYEMTKEYNREVIRDYIEFRYNEYI